jgi:hypothetical protein
VARVGRGPQAWTRSKRLWTRTRQPEDEAAGGLSNDESPRPSHTAVEQRKPVLLNNRPVGKWPSLAMSVAGHVHSNNTKTYISTADSVPDWVLSQVDSW